MRKFIFSLFLLLLPLSAQALAVPSAPIDYVLDEAGLFSESFEEELSQTILSLDQATTGQIGILTIPTLDGEVLEEYAVEVFREWGIGQEADDNGVLLLIAVEEHDVRIEVGYGLEGRITDADASRIIRDAIVPAFSLEQYEEGTRDAVSQLISEIETEAQEEGFVSMFTDGPEEREGLALYLSEGIGMLFIAFVIFIILVVVYGLMQKRTREKARKLPVPHAMMLFVLITSSFTAAAWVSGLLASHAVFAILKKTKLDGRGGGKGGGTRRRNPVKIFRGGSGGFGGGSFGGFGGGSSGGGGASGKW